MVGLLLLPRGKGCNFLIKYAGNQPTNKAGKEAGNVNAKLPPFALHAQTIKEPTRKDNNAHAIKLKGAK
jgi:hypothetical protein